MNFNFKIIRVVKIIKISIFRFVRDIFQILFRFKIIKNQNKVLKNNYENVFSNSLIEKKVKNLRYVSQIFSIFHFLITENKKKIKIIDWGGGYGQQAFDVIDKYDHIIDIEWHVLEQKKLVEQGMATSLKYNIKFLENINENYDLCFFNGSISYLEIKKIFPLVAKHCKYVHISRLGISNEPTIKIYDRKGSHEEYVYNYNEFFDELNKFFEIIEILDDEKLRPEKTVYCTHNENTLLVLAKNRNNII
jgi:putative methyltransferase (TIGR04325 family)